MQQCPDTVDIVIEVFPLHNYSDYKFYSQSIVRFNDFPLFDLRLFVYASINILKYRLNE